MCDIGPSRPDVSRIFEERSSTTTHGSSDWRAIGAESRSDEPIARSSSKPVRSCEPLQLDLFIPTDYEYDYSVIATSVITLNGIDGESLRLSVASINRKSENGPVGARGPALAPLAPV